MTYISTPDDIKLYVKDWGKGSPVILIHGLTADLLDFVGR